MVEASQLGREIGQNGSANVHGILFDHDKADIRPESQPQPKAIAVLPSKSPALRLDVVGHTDNQGSAAHNLELSGMRAFSVVAELSTRFSSDRSRLHALGKGLEQPLASNAGEAGRARNRRVELVRR